MRMKNIKLILEYDGTNYHGWQSQIGSGMPTIQDVLEQALKKITGEQVKTVSSGRTDAGVHALGHVASFKSASRVPAEAWAPALNQILPNDIRVLLSEEVHEDFHARFSAQGKIYIYRVLNRRAPSALYRNYSWHVNMLLKLKNMRSAAACLVGTHDFTAFRSSGCGAKTPVRTIKTLTIKKRGEFVEILLEADAFLMHMARNIVGTLVEVGLNRRPVEDVKRILLSCDRNMAGRSAPSCGLYLLKVFYLNN
jgi:tRNA pseudouridine38-40 synthase